MAAHRSRRSARGTLTSGSGVLAVAALLALGGCLSARRPVGLAPGSDMVRAEPALQGAVRRAIQRCDGPAQIGATGGAREPDRCSRARTDTVRASPDTVERVHRVP
jgi:hypothetical protein